MVEARSKVWIICLLTLFVSLSGCVVIEKVRPAGLTITEEEVKAVRVVKVEIDDGQMFASENVVKNLHASLKNDLALCATGDREMKLRIRLDTFVEQSPGGTFFVGGQTQLAGLIELRDPKTNDLVAEYYGVEFDAAGGLLGIAILSNADNNLPVRFSRNICEKVFLNPLKTPLHTIASAGPAPDVPINSLDTVENLYNSAQLELLFTGAKVRASGGFCRDGKGYSGAVPEFKVTFNMNGTFPLYSECAAGYASSEPANTMGRWRIVNDRICLTATDHTFVQSMPFSGENCMAARESRIGYELLSSNGSKVWTVKVERHPNYNSKEALISALTSLKK